MFSRREESGMTDREGGVGDGEKVTKRSRQ